MVEANLFTIISEDLKPIPLELPQVLGWKEIPIVENNEPLVPLGSNSSYTDLFTNSIYFGERDDSPYLGKPFEGSLLTVFVREGVAEQLRNAQNLLPNNQFLMIYDAYRPFKVQQALFNKYHDELQQKNPELTDEVILTEVQKFVSIPSQDPTRPSPHNTGGAVDLAIFSLPLNYANRVTEINLKLSELDSKSWQQRLLLEAEKNKIITTQAIVLDFGTPLDFGGSESALNYYERESKKRKLTPFEVSVQFNRRLLYSIMTTVGFEPYDDEWWHFNSNKSQMGAKAALMNNAEYGAKNLLADHLKHEQIRRKIKNRISRINNGQNIIETIPNYIQQAYLVYQAAESHLGNPTTSVFPRSSIISPE